MFSTFRQLISNVLGSVLSADVLFDIVFCGLSPASGVGYSTFVWRADAFIFVNAYMRIWDIYMYIFNYGQLDGMINECNGTYRIEANAVLIVII